MEKTNDVKNNYYLQFSQRAIIYDPAEKKFLLAKLREEGFFYKKYGPWELVGGRLDKGENLKSSLEREIKEEIGGDTEIKIRDIVDVIPMTYKSGEAVFAAFLVEYSGGEIVLSEEHGEYRWETAEAISKSGEYKDWLKGLIAKAVKILEKEDYLDGWKRCQADFENYKKEQTEKYKDLVRYAAENIVLQVLPVLDNFHASTGHIPEDRKESPWVQGIMYIQKQLEGVLADNGIQEIGAKPGDGFDPRFHEAVREGEIEAEEKKQENKIKKVIQKGYKIGDKIIRPAKVVVG